MESTRVEVLQAVVDRLTSYQSAAPDGTVERELRSAVDEADLTLTDAEITAVAGAIEAADGRVDVAALLS